MRSIGATRAGTATPIAQRRRDRQRPRRASGLTDNAGPAASIGRPARSRRAAAVRAGRFDGRTREAALYRWSARRRARAPGPAVVAGAEATAVVPPAFAFARRRRRKRDRAVARADALPAIDFEVFKNLFLAVAEEMGVTLRRTGFSPNIKERLDYSCAVYDARRRRRSRRATTCRCTSARCRSRCARRSRPSPWSRAMPCMLNDPFHGGTHLPDITLVSPVFLDRRATARPPCSTSRTARITPTSAG